MPAKEPQHRTDIAAVIKVALGANDYRFGSLGRDFAFSRKQQIIFQRVADRVGLTIHFGTVNATLRSNNVRIGAPLIQTDKPRELAAMLMSEYADRGGPQ